jgi:uncharacterized surface protein with fasciclin (FAS1) repeats
MSSRKTIDSIQVPENYQLTIFVPYDAAFTKFPISILLDSSKLFELVSYHVVPTTVNRTAIDGQLAFKTLSNDDIIIGHDVGKNSSDQGYVLSKLNSKATIIGSVSVEQISTIFVDSILQPPVSISETAIELDWTKFSSLLDRYSPRPTVTMVQDFTM